LIRTEMAFATTVSIRVEARVASTVSRGTAITNRVTAMDGELPGVTARAFVTGMEIPVRVQIL
jgi:hypothetical protein